MKLLYNDWIGNDLKDYLMSQDGIKNVEINDEVELTSVTIDGDLDPFIVGKYIDLFLENPWSILFEFDKGNNNNVKELTYKVEDMCCEYCHMNFVQKLFDNKNIISVKSNYKLPSPAINIGYMIKYDESCDENEIKDYIENNLFCDKIK